MNLAGLTDSLATGRSDPTACRECGAMMEIGAGLCLGCILGLGVGEDDLAGNEFSATLSALPVADTHWQLGNYEVLEEIGRGGMGVIYRARQRHSRRIVALKRVLSHHSDSRETLARFRREAETAARLDHPNILPIYEVGESDEGVPYFSMKFAPGGSLQEVGPALRDNPREVVRLVAQVTRAVQCAHRQGILHRDLKPGNVLLDGSGQALVSDFGLAKWLDTTSDLTRSLTIFGTPGFIAPEQAEGIAANLTPAADVYSLGAILFSLLTGQPPFLGEHALAVIRQAAEKAAPKLRSLVPGASRDLETICERCLEREPQARYHSAGDLAEDLERWLEGRPIKARPLSPPVRLWRWSRRNPIAASSGVVIALLAATTLFFVTARGNLARTVDKTTTYRHSLAVLPLLNLDTVLPDSTLADSLATALQKDMHRIGPSQAESYQDLGLLSAALGDGDDIRLASRKAASRTVLTGTIRQKDGRLRVSLRLVEASSGEILFHRLFELKADASSGSTLSLLALGEISAALEKDPHALSAETDPALRNQTASEYIRAGHRFEERRSQLDFDRALTCFQQAIDAEPASALARSYFTMAAVARINMAAPPPGLAERIKPMALEALQLNPTLPEAHRAYAAALYQQRDTVGSLEQDLQAVELGGPVEGAVLGAAENTALAGRPDLSLRWRQIAQAVQEGPGDFEYATGELWAALGEDARAGKIYRRVLALHPDQPEGWIGLCDLQLMQGRFDAARQLYREHLDNFPGFPSAKLIAARIEFFARNWPEAERLCLELVQANPESAMGEGAIPLPAALGRIRLALGEAEAGKTLLDQSLAEAQGEYQKAPGNPQLAYRLAGVLSSLGKTEESLKYLQAAFTMGKLDYRSLQLDPQFDAVRARPRFQALAKAMADRISELRLASVAHEEETTKEAK
ncbi:MAG: protein kinase domain-containing protein [Chthoniobacterales bacterium]